MARNERPGIAIACTSKRGHDFVREVSALRPDARLAVFSWKEDPWEPRYLDEIRNLTKRVGGDFHEARKLAAPELAGFWAQFRPELLLLVNWRYRVDEPTLSAPRRGTLVFHDSLLPTYRGFSPTSWAVINGEDHTGVTLLEAVAETDRGNIIDQRRVAIAPDDYIGEVTVRVTAAYLDLLRSNLDRLLEGTWRGAPQKHARASYVCRRMPDDNLIDWRAPARRIYDLIRGTSTPYSGAFTYLGDLRLTILRAAPDGSKHYVGRVPGGVAEVRRGSGSVVMTGDGALLVTEVQLPGGTPRPAAEILNSITLRLRTSP